jgi:hypothetical protein
VRRTILAAALLPCALTLASCSSSAKTGSGTTPIVTRTSTAAAPVNEGLTQAELTAKIKAALTTATALHVQGTMTSSGQATTMDLQLNKDGSAQGTMGISGATMPIIVVNGVSYIQFTSSYIQMMEKSAGSGDSATFSAYMAKYENKWISSQNTTGAQLTQGTDGLTFSSMTSQMIDNADEKYTYLGTGTVDGQEVARYNDVDKQSGTAILSIPISGPALPIQVDAGSQGTITLTWNQPTTVTAPPASDIATFTMPTS